MCDSLAYVHWHKCDIANKMQHTKSHALVGIFNFIGTTAAMRWWAWMCVCVVDFIKCGRAGRPMTTTSRNSKRKHLIETLATTCFVCGDLTLIGFDVILNIIHNGWQRLSQSMQNELHTYFGILLFFFLFFLRNVNALKCCAMGCAFRIRWAPRFDSMTIAQKASDVKINTF